MSANVVVVGAGVSGLSTALLLAKSGKYTVTVIAKHMPGDYDIEYASPWAGANVMPVAKPGTSGHGYERDTWFELQRLARDMPECGIHFQDCHIFRRDTNMNSAVGQWVAEMVKEDAWFKDVLPNFRVLGKSELPRDVDGGTAFTSVCINTSLYLPWLVSKCLKHGVVLKRAVISHICEAVNHHHSARTADLVVNCTGLSSLRLGGVEDKAMFPGRGQVVLVRNDPGIMMSSPITDDGEDEVTYIMHRAAGGGCILGGCLQAGNWESQPDHNLAVRIMTRAVKLCPSLVPPGKGIEALSVVRHAVGLRPMRKGGIRVEKETISGPGGGRKVPVVHNYGHGGYGYQTSFGAATAAVKLVEELLQLKARL